MRRKKLEYQKFEYQFATAQAFWTDSNSIKLFPDLNEWGREGWRIIQIVPREKDFFDIFFERQISPYAPEKI